VLAADDLVAVARYEAALIVLEETAEAFGVSAGTLIARSNVRQMVEARRQAALRLRGAGMYLKEIGALLGGRDHSTVSTLLSAPAGRR
jgi:chromosomal replication initiation ATPase DnaA